MSLFTRIPDSLLDVDANPARLLPYANEIEAAIKTGLVAFWYCPEQDGDEEELFWTTLEEPETGEVLERLIEAAADYARLAEYDPSLEPEPDLSDWMVRIEDRRPRVKPEEWATLVRLDLGYYGSSYEPYVLRLERDGQTRPVPARIIN